MDFNSKRIGNVNEVQCMLSFMKLGYNVLVPFGDCERYDFVVDYKNTFIKIQCKTPMIKSNGECIKINGRSSTRKKGKCVHHKYTKDEIDYFASFYNGKCYLIDVEEMGCAKILRLKETHNSQKNRVNIASDYELEKVLPRI